MTTVDTAMDLNLDALPLNELEAFATRCGTCGCYAAVAKELFPARPKGYRKAADRLSHYAWNKLTAMQCRLRGDIETAARYETICDRIYAELPEWAKGW